MTTTSIRDVARLAGIGQHQEGVAARTLDQADRFRTARLGSHGNRDGGTVPREGKRGGAADAAAGAGDQRHLAGKVRHQVRPGSRSS